MITQQNQDRRKIPGSGWRILIVDDEPDLLELMALYLEETLEGAEVQTAISGPDGLEALRGGPAHLIISDFRMPVMDGIEFLSLSKVIRPDALRVLFTAYADEGLKERAQNEAGVIAVYSKDLSPKEFVAKIGSMILERAAGPKPA